MTRSLTVAPIADPELSRDTVAFHGALAELTRVLRFRDRDRICCHDLSVTQCDALGELARGGPLTVNELSAKLYLDKSTTSRVVRALEHKGYARRAIHPGDGRSVQLGATAVGRKLHQRIEAEILESEQVLLAEFDSATRKALTRLLAKVGAAAAGTVETRGGSCCRID